MSVPTFLGCPTFPTANSVRIVSIPSSRGSLAPSRANLGPGHLRMASQFISSDGIPSEGLRDVEGGFLCSGLSICDLGDYDYPGSEVAAQSLQEAVFGEPGLAGLALLGDDSGNFPLLVGRAGILVHIDAHDDRSERGSTINHANFLRILIEHSPELRVLQLGARGILHPSRILDTHPRVTRVPHVHALLEELDRAPIDTDLYVAWDVDVLDPSVLPHVACPEPSGFTVGILRETLMLLGGDPRLRLLSLSEFSPSADQRASLLSALTLVQLVIRFLDALSKRDQGGLA